MAKIISLSLPRLENGTLARFLEEVTGFATKDEKLNEHCGDQVEAVVVAYNLLMLMLEKHNVDLLTTAIEKADKWRDSCYSILRNTIKMMRNALEPEKKLAAENLWKIVTDYGYLSDMKYAKQTGLMNSFIQDLQTNHMDDVETLGVKQMVLDMQAANDEYKRLVNERTENYASWVKGEMLKARQQCYDKYRDLVEAITGLSIVMGDADFLPFVDILNAIIRRYRIGLGLSPDDTNSPTTTEPETPPTTEPETPPTTEPETPPTTEPSGKNEVIYRYPETGEVITTQEYEVGEKIVPPTPPTGYVWGYYPDNMPDRNVFVDALPDVIDF